MTPQTWHISWQEQAGSAVFFYGLIPALIIFGIWLIVRDTVANWSIDDANDEIDDLTDWLLMDRDQHLGAERAAMRARRGR